LKPSLSMVIEGKQPRKGADPFCSESASPDPALTHEVELGQRGREVVPLIGWKQIANGLVGDERRRDPERRLALVSKRPLLVQVRV